MIGQSLTPHATTFVGMDLFANETWNISSRRRVIQGIACVGGNAINEASFDLFVEDKKIGTFYNTHSGAIAPLVEDSIPLGRVYVPPGSKISAIVAVVPTISDLIVRVY